MEEDLEILKEFLELRELHSSNSMSKSYLTIYQEAVRNLITRYKELKQKYNNKLISIQKEREEYEKDFIQKSKVKEILNKLSNHNYKCNFDDVDFLQNIIIEIQQLLED